MILKASFSLVFQSSMLGYVSDVRMQMIEHQKRTKEGFQEFATNMHMPKHLGWNMLRYIRTYGAMQSFILSPFGGAV